MLDKGLDKLDMVLSVALFITGLLTATGVAYLIFEVVG